MLLIYCFNCEDLVKPVPNEKRTCICKSVKLDGAEVHGEHAEVGLAPTGQFSFDAALTSAKYNGKGKLYGFVSLS